MVNQQISNDNYIKSYNINRAMTYAKSLIGIPYRWYKIGENMHNDKIWASNGPMITAEEIKIQNKSIVCTGLINLIRRYMNLPIPGLDGEEGIIGNMFPGTMWTWFHYLKRTNRLEEINFNKKYPIGTLLLSDFKSIQKPGHIAIIISESENNVKEQYILHSYSYYSYKEGINMENSGITGIQKIDDFNDKILDWFKVTHICLPENWLLN